MSKAAVLIEFDAAVDPSSSAFVDKLTAAVRNGLQSEGWDDRLAKVVDVQAQGDDRDRDKNEAEEKKASGSGSAAAPHSSKPRS